MKRGWWAKRLLSPKTRKIEGLWVSRFQRPGPGCGRAAWPGRKGQLHGMRLRSDLCELFDTPFGDVAFVVGSPSKCGLRRRRYTVPGVSMPLLNLEWVDLPPLSWRPWPMRHADALAITIRMTLPLFPVDLSPRFYVAFLCCAVCQRCSYVSVLLHHVDAVSEVRQALQRAAAGCQRWGSNSSRRLLRWVGRRASTSRRYSHGLWPLSLAD
jgi:hypothetical protein